MSCCEDPLPVVVERDVMETSAATYEQVKVLEEKHQPSAGSAGEALEHASPEHELKKNGVAPAEVDIDMGVKEGEITERQTEETPASKDQFVGRAVSLSRLTIKGAPSLAFCLVMILTGMFYTFHHRKLHQQGGGGMILERLEREFTNLAILAALMMAVVFTQVFMMYDAKELYFIDVREDGLRAVSWQYTLNFVALILSAIGEVLALIFSIINLITLNLVASDELILYLQHAAWTAKLPILMLIYGTVTWVVNILIAVFFFTDFTTGLIFNILIVGCAIFVFYTWCVMLQSTYIASQHAELINIGVHEIPTLPGWCTAGGDALHMEEVQEKIRKVSEAPVEEMPHLHEQKLVKRLSKSNLSLAKKGLFTISHH